MRKTSLLCLLLLIVLGSLCGCKLAKQEQEVSQKDRLLGFYITREPISDKEDKRVDAVKRSTIKDGVKDEEYTYEDYDGVPIFYAVVKPTKDGTMDYITLMDSEYIADSTIASKNTGIDIEGTIYFDESERQILYLNPVYQTTADEVYMLPAKTGVEQVPSMSMSGSGKYTQSVDGKEVTYESKVTVHFEKIKPTNTMTIKQYSKEDELLSTVVIDKKNIPSTIKKEAGMEYIIATSSGLYGEDGQEGKREVYDRESDHVCYYHLDKNGLAKRSDVELID